MADSPIAAPPSPPRPRGVAIGDWNYLEASIGQRGTGKSTWQCYRAWELARQAGGAYVVGHSMGARLPRRLPDELGGAELPVRYYTTIDKLERGLRSRPGDWHILAPPIAGDGSTRERDGAADPDTADDLLRFAIRLSTSIRKQAYERAHILSAWGPNKDTTGLVATPIIVVVDEGIAVEAAGTGSRSRGADLWFLQLLASLRHYHIALLYAIQDPSARSWRILEAATRIEAFRVRHDWAVNVLQAAAGATRDEVAEIRRLPKYQHATLVDVEADERAATAAAAATSPSSAPSSSSVETVPPGRAEPAPDTMR